MVGVNSSSDRLVEFSAVAAAVGILRRRELRLVKANQNRRRRVDGDRAMTRDSTKPAIGSAKGEHFLCDHWSDPWKIGRSRAGRQAMAECSRAPPSVA
jgi:hypothetical protein